MLRGSGFTFRQFDPQPRRDRARDFLLYLEDVLNLAIEALAPELRVVGGIDQLCLDHQVVAAVGDSAGEDRVDSQLAAQRSRIDLPTSIPKRRGSGQDLYSPKSGEAVDDAFRDTVTKVRRGLVGRDEWQDGDDRRRVVHGPTAAPGPTMKRR